MTINKEEITADSSNNPIYLGSPRRYDEDRQLLVSLLSEYGDKLLGICKQIEEFQPTSSILGQYPIMFLFWSVGVLIFLVASIVWNIYKSVVVTSVVLILSPFILLWMITVLNRRIVKVKILKREARAIYLRLEKVTRIAYQVQENLSPSSITRVELDLRLADAESALEYYNTITKGK